LLILKRTTAYLVDSSTVSFCRRSKQEISVGEIITAAVEVEVKVDVDAAVEEVVAVSR
jgi:hypothetical protein